MAVRKKTSINYYLSLDNSKFNRALAYSSKKLKSATRAFKRYGTDIAVVGTAAGAAAAGGFYLLNKALSETVRLANIQDAAEAKLAAVIKATGGAAGLTAEQMNKYAGELQSVTTYGDEATISAMAVLASFKNIKGDNFKAATAAAQDMATVMNTDLNSSILQIGKAMNDPIKGISALSRAGVQFTDTQKAQIKKMQESGNVMGAQKVILKELANQFGGAAAAARKTFGGALDAAKNSLGDLKEEIGFAFTKNAALVEGLKAVEEQFKSWAAKLTENREQTKKWATDSTVAVLSFSANTIKAIATTFEILNNLGQTLMLAYTSTLRLASGALYYQKVIAGLKGDEDAVNKLHKERLNLQYDIQQAYENIMNADKAADKANQWADNAVEKINDLKKVIENTEIEPAEAIVSDGAKVETVLKKVGNTWVNEAKKSSQAVGTDWKNILKETEKTTEDSSKTNLDYWLKALSDMSQGTSKYVNDMVNELERLQMAQAAASSGGGAAGGYRWGGLVNHFASGGKLSGYGGGDRIRALLEAGEFVIRKEAVARYGAGMFSALNNLRLPELPKFASGGPVMAGANAGSGENITLHFSFPGEVNQPKGSFSPSDAKSMINILKRQHRLRA